MEIGRLVSEKKNIDSYISCSAVWVEKPLTEIEISRFVVGWLT